MNNKFYAVKCGKTPGIYYDWESCKSQVDGFSGAEYKRFKSLAEACRWLGMKDPLIPAEDISHDEKISDTASSQSGQADSDAKPDDDGSDALLSSLPEGHAVSYVDGSYNESNMKFSYGVVFFHDGKEEHISKAFNHSGLSAMRNVAGEIMGAGEAMRTALDRGCSKLIIYHDYEGIAKWCTGEWKTNKEWTKKYKDFYDEASKQMDIEFIKVKAHSKDKFNDLADSLAKAALEG